MPLVKLLVCVHDGSDLKVFRENVVADALAVDQDSVSSYWIQKYVDSSGKGNGREVVYSDLNGEIVGHSNGQAGCNRIECDWWVCLLVGQDELYSNAAVQVQQIQCE